MCSDFVRMSGIDRDCAGDSVGFWEKECNALRGRYHE